MLAVVRSTWALLLGIALLMLGHGLQSTLLSVRAGQQFGTAITGIVMSGYFAGLIVGSLLTPRLALDRLSAGTPPLDDETWRLLQVMMTSDMTPEAVAAELQAGLSSWYSPQSAQ